MTAHTPPPAKLAFPLYTPAGFYLLRAPVLPASIFTRLANVSHLAAEIPAEKLDMHLLEQQESGLQMLEELAARPEIAQALLVASPSLVEGLERLQQTDTSPARKKRLYASLLRYLIRMSTRPTPFGLFAGVALGHFASETKAHLAAPPVARFRTRPDMYWLLSALRQLEEDPAVVRQLTVSLNQTAALVGERAVLPFADTYGQQDGRAISLRATAVVRKVFELARRPLPYLALRGTLLAAFPRASEQQVDGLLWQLWEHHFLLSHLHPPLTAANPAAYVYQQLRELQHVESFTEKLGQVLEDAAALDQAGRGAPLSLISELVRKQAALAKGIEGQLPIQIDTALHLPADSLHQDIGRAAARAAEFFLRHTGYAQGPTHLREYRQLFEEKYGLGVEVPLLDLLSPERGLDAPPTYEKPPRITHHAPGQKGPESRAYTTVLVDLVAQALRQHKLEIELTEELQHKLERWTPTVAGAPLALEIYLQVHARSRAELDAGKWTVVVGGSYGAHGGGRTFGRFFDLLGEAGMQALTGLTKLEEGLMPEAIFAELSYQPWQARLANVAIRPPLRDYEIAIGTTPSVSPDHVLPLNDLVVGVRAGRFYLRSLHLNKQIYVCQNHLLNPRLAPNVCRFLSEISHDALPALSAFDWGPLNSSPFLPRLVVNLTSSARLVLAVACWQLNANTITPGGTGSFEARWFRGLQDWRREWNVPRYVYLTEYDNRLLLDLEHSLMATELYNALKKQTGEDRIILEEMLPDFEHLWLRDERNAGYLAEIVVPLLRTDAIEPAARPTAQERKASFLVRVISAVERNSYPGEAWTYIKWYAAPTQHEQLIAGPMREIVTNLETRGLIDRWFFIRYADPEPHLRLRFHARDMQKNDELISSVLSWSLNLARRDLIRSYVLDTYEREVERYGGPQAMDLLEQVFAIDSAIVSTIVANQYARRLTLDPLTMAVCTLDHGLACWGLDMQERHGWLSTKVEKYAFSKEFHTQRKAYCDLLTRQSPPDQAEQSKLLYDLLDQQVEPLGKLSKEVGQLVEASQLWVSEDELLSSLAHMHLNRLLGIDPSRERKIYAFWRHTLDALRLKPS